jgi:hypothetical protein
MPSGIQLFARTSFDAHWGFTHTRLNTAVERTANKLAGILNMGIIRLLSDDGSYKTWTEYMQIYECSFELSAVEYAGWRVENGAITPGSLIPTR